MKSLIIIVLGFGFFFWNSDFSATDTWSSLIAPLGSVVFLIAFTVWLVAKAGLGGKADRSGGYGGDGGFWGGGDGGGCD